MTTLLCALLPLAVSGCAAGSAPAVVADAAAPYLCADLSVPAEALATELSVSELDHTDREALEQAEYDDGAPLELDDEASWIVVTRSDEQLVLLRTVGDRPDGDTSLRRSTHDVIAVSRVQSTNVDGRWMVTTSGSCTLTIDLGPLTIPDVSLDPAHPPDASSTEVSLLVQEQSCNSGEDASGRIETVRLEETLTQVLVTLGIDPRDGLHSCPSNPATPFTITLDEPLGDRELRNGAMPSQPLITD